MSSDAPCSERQVTLREAIYEDSIPETMEDIKISIVNDRATCLKRHREEKKAVTSCSKRLCNTDFIGSTPHSLSRPPWNSPPSTSKSKDARPSHVSTPSHTLEQNSEFGNEWDDSLLEPSDGQDDSPLYLTVDEIESLLEEDSCFAADYCGSKECNSTCNVSPESDNEKKEVCSSPCSLRETTFCEEDLNNYATVAPSLPILHSAEVQLSKQESIVADNVIFSDSVEESKELPSSALLTLDNKEALTNQLSCNSSAYLPVQSPTSLYTVDVVVEWNDDPELHFDGDIDNLLAISPGGETSCEEGEETAAEPYIQRTEHITSAVSDSISTFKQSNIVPANQIANSVESDTVDAVQQLPPSISHQSDALKTHHPASTQPDLPKDSGSPLISTVVISETQSNTDAAEDVTPNVSTENDAQTTAGLNDQPLNSSSAQTSNSQHTTTASVTNSSSAQQRSCPVVPPMPRLTHRSILSSIELEHDKDNYCNQVIMHIDGPEGTNLGDPLSELASLLNQISRENQNWQHPSNFSRRNHPRRGRRPSKHYTLKEWVHKNGGVAQRFMDIPSPFQRNPFPEHPHL